MCEDKKLGKRELNGGDEVRNGGEEEEGVEYRDDKMGELRDMEDVGRGGGM